MMTTVDSQQFSQWMRELRGPLVLFARQWNHDDAEDVVQEAFFALVRQIRRHGVPENVPAWLFKVVRTAILENHRADSRRKNREEKIAQDRQAWFCPNLEAELDSQYAANLLGELPLQQREIVAARIWGTLSFDEIAGLLNLPKTSVFRQYTEALQTLREKMS